MIMKLINYTLQTQNRLQVLLKIIILNPLMPGGNKKVTHT